MAASRAVLLSGLLGNAANSGSNVAWTRQAVDIESETLGGSMLGDRLNVFSREHCPIRQGVAGRETANDESMMDEQIVESYETQ